MAEYLLPESGRRKINRTGGELQPRAAFAASGSRPESVNKHIIDGAA